MTDIARRTISVKTYHGSKDLDAVVVGPLAVHLNVIGTDGERVYCLHHMPTGLGLGIVVFDAEAEAIAAARMLLKTAIDWQSDDQATLRRPRIAHVVLAIGLSCGGFEPLLADGMPVAGSA